MKCSDFPDDLDLADGPHLLGFYIEIEIVILMRYHAHVIVVAFVHVRPLHVVVAVTGDADVEYGLQFDARRFRDDRCPLLSFQYRFPDGLVVVGVGILDEEGEFHLRFARKLAELESDFAERYKDEIYDAAIRQARSELEGKIRGLEDKVSELEIQAEQNRIMSQNAAVTEDRPMMIELGSDDESVSTIELGSVTVEIGEQPAAYVPPAPPAIPSAYRNSTPGIPEIRVPEKTPSVKNMVFSVERTGEETLYSESFTDAKYFVHISPDCNLLVIRPNEFGKVFCMNRRLRLKGLNKLSAFTGPKRLVAEYNERYEGMIVYL